MADEKLSGWPRQLTDGQRDGLYTETWASFREVAATIRDQDEKARILFGFSILVLAASGVFGVASVEKSPLGLWTFALILATLGAWGIAAWIYWPRDYFTGIATSVYRDNILVGDAATPQEMALEELVDGLDLNLKTSRTKGKLLYFLPLLVAMQAAIAFLMEAIFRQTAVTPTV
jgi:hypothetical protein